MRKILKRLHPTLIGESDEENPEFTILGPSESDKPTEHADEVVLNIEMNCGNWQIPLSKLKMLVNPLCCMQRMSYADKRRN